MKSTRTSLYLVSAWILTVAISYMIGWWTGVKNTTHVVTGAAHSGMGIVLILLAIVAVLSAMGALRAQGFIDHHRDAH